MPLDEMVKKRMDIGYCYLCWWQIEKVKKSMPKYLYFFFVVGQGCVRAKASFIAEWPVQSWGPYLEKGVSGLGVCTLWLLSWNSWSFYFWIYFVSKFQLESGALLWFRSTGSRSDSAQAWLPQLPPQVWSFPVYSPAQVLLPPSITDKGKGMVCWRVGVRCTHPIP